MEVFKREWRGPVRGTRRAEGDSRARVPAAERERERERGGKRLKILKNHS